MEDGPCSGCFVGHTWCEMETKTAALDGNRVLRTISSAFFHQMVKPSTKKANPFPHFIPTNRGKLELTPAIVLNRVVGVGKNVFLVRVC